jgi:alpha-L-fucosidase
MFDTKTTDFNVIETPYGRDVTRELVDAFRRHGIAIGFYFSPDDFWMLRRQGLDVSRQRPDARPANNPELMEHNKRQLRELLTRYGPIDMLFLDGLVDEKSPQLKRLAWQIQPNIVVTRGEMKTPEQEMPGQPMPGPWEACFTLGTQWQFKPTHEQYKSGTELIEMLIEIRAKGGNFLLNVGPTPDGEIPFEQTRRMRELALWLFINREAIYDIRPWHVIREGNVWFTKSRDGDSVYAFVTKTPWAYGERKEIALRSVRATDKTEVSVLGHAGRVLEYQPDVDAAPRWRQDADGLHVSAMRAQRIHNDRRWPDPVVIKITHARPAE